MKKEKTIRTYQRRTKSGKMVTVKQHTAKYDAAEKAREMAKKKGAGSELEELKKKGKTPVQLEIDFDNEDNKEKDKAIVEEVKKSVKKETEKNSKSNKKETPKKAEKKVSAKESKTTKSSEPAFTAAEFKEWYRGTGSEADKKVAKALRKQLGRAGYNKLEDEAIDNYSSRGHLKMFKSLSSTGEDVKYKPNGKTESKETKATKDGDFQVKESALKRLDKEISRLEKSPKLPKEDLHPRVREAMYSRREDLRRYKKAKEYLENGDRLKAAKLLVPNIDNEHGKFKPSEFYSKAEVTTLKDKAAKKHSVGTGTNGPESKKSQKVHAPTDAFERAELIQALKSKGKGTFDRVKMSKKYGQYFAKGSWNPSALGKAFIAEHEKASSKSTNSATRPAEVHPHNMYNYSPEVKKQLDSMEKKLKPLWKEGKKYGLGTKSGPNTPAKNIAFARKVEALESKYYKLLNDTKGLSETPEYKKYKSDYDAYRKQKRSSEAKEQKTALTSFKDSAAKKGYTYVGTHDGELIFHKNGKAYSGVVGGRIARTTYPAHVFKVAKKTGVEVDRDKVKKAWERRRLLK